MKVLHRAERILMDELPVIPIYYYVTKDIWSARLGGFHANIMNEHFPKFWYWMDDEELEQKRANYPEKRKRKARLESVTGPPEGLYSPAQQRKRQAK